MSDCWLWSGKPNTGGYGRVRVDGRQVRAHRFVYESMVGPIPDGMTIDHLCKNRMCVNPEHLEPVPMEENVRRGRSHHREQTHCKRGHPFSADNTYRPPNKTARVCRACAEQSRILWRSRQ